jgi:tetratricopeptide (TPR) repeat protein
MKHTGLVLSITVLLILFKVYANSNDYSRYRGLTYLFSGGISYPTGYYNDYLKSGNNISLAAFYKHNIFSFPLYYKGGLSYYNYELKTGGSYLHQVDFSGGVFTSYKMHHLVEPFFGADITGTFSRLNTKNTDRNENSYKPGISFNIGNMTYVNNGLGIFILLDYKITDISGKTFSPASIKAGLTFNSIDLNRDINQESETEIKFQLFQKAQNEFRNKNFDEAKKLFNEVYEMDNEYPGINYNLTRIKEIEADKAQADNYIKQKNYIRAIPHLQFCAPYIKDCETNLARYRKDLSASIKSWENDGIRHYEAGRYRDCINLMEKILLIDPDNRTAAIYLPRATRRQKAIDALQR